MSLCLLAGSLACIWMITTLWIIYFVRSQKSHKIIKCWGRNWKETEELLIFPTIINTHPERVVRMMKHSVAHIPFFPISNSIPTPCAGINKFWWLSTTNLALLRWNLRPARQPGTLFLIGSYPYPLRYTYPPLPLSLKKLQKTSTRNISQL